MKIALIIERMEPMRGGRETSMAQVAVHLVRRGHEVTIICQQASWSYEGVQVCQLGCKGLLRLQHLCNFIADAQRTIKAGDYDIVHSTLPLPGANVYQPRGGTVPAQVDSRLRRGSSARKLIVALDEQLKVRRRVMRKLERQVVENPKVLCLAVSGLVAEEFNYYYQRRDGVRIIHNGVDAPDVNCLERTQWREQKRKYLGVGADAFVLLSVANNFALKGVPEAVGAFAKWYHSRGGKSQARLVVVGNDKSAAYERGAKKNGVAEQVIFAGPTEDIFQWYAAADACILLSWYDPCSRVVLEAVRWGIPSVTTAYNGAAEVLDEGGIVVKSPADTEAVVAAIDRLCEPSERAELGKNCLQISEKVSIERHVDELLKAYTEMLGR